MVAGLVSLPAFRKVETIKPCSRGTPLSVLCYSGVNLVALFIFRLPFSVVPFYFLALFFLVPESFFFLSKFPAVTKVEKIGRGKVNT